MKFAPQMTSAQKKLQDKGFQVSLPDQAEEYIENTSLKDAVSLGAISAERKIKHDFIRKHYNQIAKSDAILVLNYDKNGIENYIGGNTFLEMGFAYILGKKIYTLHPLPEGLPIYYQELVAMQPIVLSGDLSAITEK